LTNSFKLYHIAVSLYEGHGLGFAPFPYFFRSERPSFQDLDRLQWENPAKFRSFSRSQKKANLLNQGTFPPAILAGGRVCSRRAAFPGLGSNLLSSAAVSCIYAHKFRKQTSKLWSPLQFLCLQMATIPFF